MILIQATIRYKGYDPEDLKPKSRKRVCCSCDSCGRVRWVAKQGYRDLCGSCALNGRKLSKLHKDNISKNHSRKCGIEHHCYGEKHPNWGKHLSKEIKQKISISHIGSKNYNYGKHLSDEHKEAISKGNILYYINNESYNKGKTYNHTEKTKIAISCGHQGIKIEDFDGFIGFGKYCYKFNDSCRESNRNKYNRKCFICGKNEEDNKRKLSVHHVDMNKQQGCNGESWKLVPVCINCHGMLHTDLWKNRIEYLLGCDY